MNETTSVGFAAGKVILFGEHAVVYGQPAIAVPVTDLKAMATVSTNLNGDGIRIIAANLPDPQSGQTGHEYFLHEANSDDPLRATVEIVLSRLVAETGSGHIVRYPNIVVKAESEIPIACGLGSGAAIATAVVRALSNHFTLGLSASDVSKIVYEVEKLHHGNPSGIDNTVVAFEQAVYFVRGEKISRLRIKKSLTLVIGDTGVTSPTRDAVDFVARQWKADPARNEGYFKEIGDLTRRARAALETGDHQLLGLLMNENQVLLEQMGVSSPELDTLTSAARRAGGLGSKLSGAGWGGNMIALVEPDTARAVAESLQAAGAAHVIVTEVS